MNSEYFTCYKRTMGLLRERQLTVSTFSYVFSVLSVLSVFETLASPYAG